MAGAESVPGVGVGGAPVEAGVWPVVEQAAAASASTRTMRTERVFTTKRLPLTRKELRYLSSYRLISRRAKTMLWTSSGPSAMRKVRACAHIRARGTSSLIPAPPWT